MLTSILSYGGQYDTWDFFNHGGDGTYHITDHVVHFDGPTRTIWIPEGVEEVLVKEYLYSDWKEWVRIYDNSKWLQAFQTEGGRPISDTERLGDTYLLINDWQIRQMDAQTPCNVDGNLYAYDENGDPKYPYGLDPNGLISINSTVSNLVNTVVIETPAKGMTPEQEWILKLAYEEARRSRAMQTNRVDITNIGTAEAPIDRILVYDDDNSTILYEIRVDGSDCNNRTLQDFKPYCPLVEVPTDPCP